MIQTLENDYTQTSLCNTSQVQVATQTHAPASIGTASTSSEKKTVCPSLSSIKGKKSRLLFSQQSTSQQTLTSSPVLNLSSQNFEMDPTSKLCFIYNIL